MGILKREKKELTQKGSDVKQCLKLQSSEHITDKGISAETKVFFAETKVWRSVAAKLLGKVNTETAPFNNRWVIKGILIHLLSISC